MESGGPAAISGPSAPRYAEHGTDIVATYTASDPENEGVEWSISGADAGEFSINSSGELSFNESPDFENPADADTNNKYELTVNATVGEESGGLEVAVTVTNGNDPPKFTKGHENRELTFEENQLYFDDWLQEEGGGWEYRVGVYRAIDPQDHDLEWTIGGPDKDSFYYSMILTNLQAGSVPDRWSAHLSISGVPLDYENPSDDNGDGVYEITLDVTDGSLVTSLPLTVTIVDVDEAPVITGDAAVDFAEDSTADVGAYSAADPEGGTATLTLSGADADSFSFSDGVLRFNSTPDHETKTCHSVTFTATDEADGSGVTRSSSLDVAIRITSESDGTPIQVTGLSVSSLPASGDTYALGETIRVTLTFSEAVDAYPARRASRSRWTRSTARSGPTTRAAAAQPA